MGSLWAGRDEKRCQRGTRVCVYPFMKMGNPEANMLSSPSVQIIESERWEHALLFHAPRVNSLLGHLRRSSFESPHDISCLSLSHYFASLFSKFLLFRTEWCFFSLAEFMLAHPSVLNSSRGFTAYPGDLCCDFSWPYGEGLGVLGEP